MRMQIIHARAYTHEAQVGEYHALLCLHFSQRILPAPEPLLCPFAAPVVVHALNSAEHA